MKIKRSLLLGLFVINGVLLLTGCSADKSGNSAMTSARNSMGGGVDTAQTQGLGNQSSYQIDSSGKVVNAMEAPSNQVYYFDFDQTALKGDAMKALLVQADYLATHPGTSIRLEGNTDQRGSREYNIGLGWRRDQAVARILEQQGVRSSQIDMVSYGKERPASFENTPEAWSLNRRVELIYKG